MPLSNSADMDCLACEGASKNIAPSNPLASDSSTQNNLPHRVVLASASPRRVKILQDLGLDFKVFSSDVDETLDADLMANPDQAAKKLAERKAMAAVQRLVDQDFLGTMIVIAADTMVVCGQEILGKPANQDCAYDYLKKLSNKTHQVITGVSVWVVADSGNNDFGLSFRSFAETSFVTFKDLSEDDIYEYLAYGEYADKAGAYAIQGQGKTLVKSVQGCMDNIIGLPSKRLVKEFGSLLGLS